MGFIMPVGRNVYYGLNYLQKFCFSTDREKGTFSTATTVKFYIYLYLKFVSGQFKLFRINPTKLTYMPLQYISDSAGNHTAVLIPITEWELLTRKHEDLKLLETSSKKKTTKKPSDFAATMPPDVAMAFKKQVEDDRSNWD
jgi:hypothetical protein